MIEDIVAGLAIAALMWIMVFMLFSF